MILGNNQCLANQTPIKWGTAPILVKSTTRAGTIKIKACVMFEGQQMPQSGELVFESIPSERKLIFNQNDTILFKRKEHNLIE